MSTKIAWCDETINPIVGCSKISDGCKFCYAEKAAASPRLQQFPQYRAVIRSNGWNEKQKGDWNGKTFFVESALEKPLHWKQPRRIFVCSMGDLFHESVPFEWILKIIGITVAAPQHEYIFLTKRSERMYEFFACYPDGWLIRKSMEYSSLSSEFFALDSVRDLLTDKKISEANDYWKNNYDQSKRGKLDGPVPFPQPNIWLGVTAENQEQADKRIPILLQIPAAKRFVSIEPMLGKIDFKKTTLFKKQHYDRANLDWVIVGAESGAKRRYCAKTWVENIVEQCKNADVPCFIKQCHDENKKLIKMPVGFPQEYPKEK